MHLEIHILSWKTYFAVDDACVNLQHTCPDMRMCVMQMFLQCVKEAVTVSFTGLVQPVTTQDPYKDLTQHLTHSNTHCVALEKSEKEGISLHLLFMIIVLLHNEF